jgi:hypothetical protein
MKTIIIAFLISTASFHVNAYESADELLSACSADKNDDVIGRLKKRHCAGYVNGMYEGIQVVFGIKPESQFICFPPDGISSGQAVRTVIKYLKDNPSELHKPASTSVLIAFEKAFPCEHGGAD